MAIPADKRYYYKLKAAQLYYIENRRQKDITDILHISKPTLIALLKEAVDEGIVHIEIRNLKNSQLFFELESQLRNALNIDDVLIAKRDKAENISHSLCALLAQHLATILKPKLKIGFGWGRTLSVLSSFLEPQRNIYELQLIPLMGQPERNAGSNMASNSLCDIIAQKYQRCSVDYFSLPLILRSNVNTKQLKELPDVQEILNKMDDLDMAIVGIDSDPKTSTFLFTEQVGVEFLDELISKGVVGNICSHFININGDIVNTSLDERIMAITPQQLKRIPQVIGVAGGSDKVRSIIGGAKTGIFNMLITDEITAQEILKTLDS